MNNNISQLLFEKGADIVRFVDISNLSPDLTQGFTKAIVFCIALSKDFIIAIRDGAQTDQDEFVDKEHETDELADWLAEYIWQKGYRAYSQSEKNIEKSGNYDEKTRSSRLPHKTIARLAGLGFIGKNNLLITKDYGCAFSMCTVLTDAPILTETYPLISSKCGPCDVCKTVCPGHAIYGNEWTESGGRDAIVDVFKCVCPLKCMVNCPHTLKYAFQADRN